METLRKRKLVAIGNSHGFLIPKFLIDNGNLKLNKEYDITIEESKTPSSEEVGGGSPDPNKKKEVE